MKICIINSFYSPDIIGGAEISVKKLAEEMVNEKNEVSVLCLGKSNLNEKINGVNVYRIKEKNLFSTFDLLTNKNMKLNKNLLKLHHLIDVVNIFNYRRIKKTLIKINPDVIHLNNLYGLSLIVVLIAKRFKIPSIITLRDYSLLYEGNNNILSKFKKNIVRSITNDINIVTAPSKYTLNYFLNKGYFKNSIRSTVYNAIDFDKNLINKIHYKKKKSILNKEKITFLYLGRLEKNKGISNMLEAFKQINNNEILLHIAGKGSEEELVNEYCESDKRIKYIGFLKEEELSIELMNCDILIIPSIWPEPFGRVILDAYKYCLPVIGSNIGGIPEIIDETTGLLIEAESIDELKESIVYFTDKKNILHMMTNLENKLYGFDIKVQCEKFLFLYKSIKGVDKYNE